MPLRPKMLSGELRLNFEEAVIEHFNLVNYSRPVMEIRASYLQESPIATVAMSCRPL